ncbi:spore germination protein [Ammonifex thiophilus]|uniref:Spore germination protein n=1 Tax=Ammonifex thiophilus TaxID=444093 RepID=A0A3D8P5B9_9THEO|nr:spore germination protein [Ammonifex thiophilus]RDV83021.1 spore germination protein [Ammonifex thiophilus]
MTKRQTPLSKNLEDNLKELDRRLVFKKNFDLILREIEIGRRKAAFLFVDAFAKDTPLSLIMREFSRLQPEEIAFNTFQKLLYRHVVYGEVQELKTLEEVIDAALSGPAVLLLDGEARAIAIDVRQYPARMPEEPDLEKVTRGSRDGFVETLVHNTALLRRRLRDPRLRIEHLTAGVRSRTDIALVYLDDVANPEIVDSVREKIQRINIDGLPMAEKTVEELITPGSFWNPFPRVRYTERPDVAAAHLLDGHVVVMVDTSPSVIILPCTFFHHLQHAEEFRQSPAIGVYLRWVRFAGVLLSIFLTPLWLLLALEPGLLPPELKFIGPKKIGAMPLFVQFLLAEVAIDMIRMATIHTPSPIATSTGIIAAVLLGDIAARAGLFIPEVTLYVATAAIGTFLTPSYELSMANRLLRLFILVLTGLFLLPGFIIGCLLSFAALALTRSFGIPYLWPLLPFNLEGLKSVLIRPPVAIQHSRPSILKPIDPDRQPQMRPEGGG